MCLIIKAETSFDAQTIIVCGTITPVGGDDFVVLDVIGDLTANATERATAINLFVRKFGAHTFGVEQTVFHQRTGRARLDTLAATDAGRITHVVIKVEDDLGVAAPARHADDVIHLNLTTGTNTKATVDASI